jgi:riboflavin kinase/FMN adenylyltransferase
MRRLGLSVSRWCCYPEEPVSARVGEGLAADGSAVQWVSAPIAITARAIADRIEAGDVVEAGELLGRPVELHGPVEIGLQRGRSLGFPTANLAMPVDQVVPRGGVYAAWATLDDGTRWPAAVNVGNRPTFAQPIAALVEAHLIGFSGDLYARTLSVHFVERLRAEHRFAAVDDLIVQLGRDVAAADRILRRGPR